jgi:outer membrane protein assembly factor BamB
MREAWPERVGARWAIDAATGGERWQIPTAARSIDTIDMPAVVAGDTIYVADDGTLRALDVADGRERWRVKCRADQALMRSGLNYVSRRPAVAEDAVFSPTSRRSTPSTRQRGGSDGGGPERTAARP